MWNIGRVLRLVVKYEDAQKYVKAIRGFDKVSRVLCLMFFDLFEVVASDQPPIRDSYRLWLRGIARGRVIRPL